MLVTRVDLIKKKEISLILSFTIFAFIILTLTILISIISKFHVIDNSNTRTLKIKRIFIFSLILVLSSIVFASILALIYLRYIIKIQRISLRNQSLDYSRT